MFIETTEDHATDLAVHEKGSDFVVIDQTHMGRRASGIERVTRELFSCEALAPLRLRTTPASSGRMSMIFGQMIANPVRAALGSSDIWVFPGYPPSPVFLLLGCTKVLYVHDMFLISRKKDLNWPARLYMSLPFSLAVRHLRYFFVNSLTTGKQLAALAPLHAQIMPFRPPAHNVFSLSPRRDTRTKSPDEPFVIGALGTVEPRKNFVGAAEIVQALSQRLARKVELHIVGRQGWGQDYHRLRSMPHVRLDGFITDAMIPKVTARWDAFICSSHDEGLGLPLLEMQHGGFPVIAPDQEIFHEVLGASGTYIRPDRPGDAANVIADLFNSLPQSREHLAQLARLNINRWNEIAEKDRQNAIVFLSTLCTGGGIGCQPRCKPPPMTEGSNALVNQISSIRFSRLGDGI
jgi:glycosyltransferase involved in cell wall biosynthesis